MLGDLRVRLSINVVALFLCEGRGLFLHHLAPPEPDRWDLPGGGLEPAEDLITGLRRTVHAGIGLTDFTVDRLLTVAEAFYPEGQGRQVHKLDLVYTCQADPQPLTFDTFDTQTIGPMGICWIPVANLLPETCTSRAWKALQASQQGA